MKPHELFELIAILTCNEYGVTWVEAMKYSHKQRKRQVARRVITSLTANFLGYDYATDLLGLHPDTVTKHIFESKRSPQAKDIKDLIYIYLKSQEPTIKSLAA